MGSVFGLVKGLCRFNQHSGLGAVTKLLIKNFSLLTNRQKKKKPQLQIIFQVLQGPVGEWAWEITSQSTGVIRRKAPIILLTTIVYSANCLTMSPGTLIPAITRKVAIPCPAICYKMYFILWSHRGHFWAVCFLL